MLNPIYLVGTKDDLLIVDYNYGKSYQAKIFILREDKNHNIHSYITDYPDKFNDFILEQIHTPFYYLPWSDTINKCKLTYPEYFI